MTATIVSATNINIKDNIQRTPSEVDVPTWEVGDQWIYQIDSMSFYNDVWHTILTFSLSMAELPITVIDTAGNFNTIEFQTSTSGQ